jgi:hypothetical protein
LPTIAMLPDTTVLASPVTAATATSVTQPWLLQPEMLAICTGSSVISRATMRQPGS